MNEASPWHREPWPWIIIGLLGSAIVASLVTLWIAVTNPDHLVVDEAQYQRIKSELRVNIAPGTAAEEEDARAQAEHEDG